MEGTHPPTDEDSSSALNVSSANITRTRGSNSFSPTELGGTQVAEEPPQSSGGVVDAIFNYLGGRTPGGQRAHTQGDTLPVAASLETPTPGHPRTMERAATENKPSQQRDSRTAGRAVTEGKPPPQRLAECGPSESVQSLLADLNAEANARLEAFLLSDHARIAAASNEDDDEELSSHIPIPEDDDGQSYHSSDEESGNEEEPAVEPEHKVTTSSGWQYTAGPDPCRKVRHTTVNVSNASSSTRPPIRGLLGHFQNTTSRTPAFSPPATVQVCSNGLIVPPNGQHAFVQPDRHGQVPQISAPDFQRTDGGSYVVPNAHNSVQSHVQGRDGQPVLVCHPMDTTVAFNDHGVLLLLSENPRGPGMTLEAFATHAGGSVHAPQAWHGAEIPAPTLQHQIGSGGHVYGCPSFAATSEEVASFAWACMDFGTDVMAHQIPLHIEPNLYVSGNVLAEHQADLRSFCINSRIRAAREADAQAGRGGSSGTTVRTPEGDHIIVRHPAEATVLFQHNGKMILVFPSADPNSSPTVMDGGAQGRLVQGGTIVSTEISSGHRGPMEKGPMAPPPSRTAIKPGSQTAVKPSAGADSRERINRSKVSKPKRRDTLYRMQTGMASPLVKPVHQPPSQSSSTPIRPVFGPPRPPVTAAASMGMPLSGPVTAHMPSQLPPPSRVSSSSSSSSNIIKDLSKLEPFDGTQESFKSFETNLERVAAVNDLEHTLDPDYWGSSLFNVKDNKIMYFLLEKAVKDNVLAYSHFKKAPKLDGNKAYFALREAFVFSGQANGAILLMKLTNFRLGQGELVSAFCLRLRELFEELEELEGEHAFVFNDTQRLGYLLTAIRNEVDLEASYTYITAEMNRGSMTFELAVADLESRCEQARADELLNQSRPRSRRHGNLGHSSTVSSDPYDSDHFDDPPDDGDRRALVSTQNKRLNQSRSSGGGDNSNATRGTKCLVKGCSELCDLPICKLHYSSLVCGKHSKLELRDGYGEATYDKVAGKTVYPDTVPARLLERIQRRRRPESKGGEGRRRR
jgi:hypothetical protein